MGALGPPSCVRSGGEPSIPHMDLPLHVTSGCIHVRGGPLRRLLKSFDSLRSELCAFGMDP